jgi:hypothetical protein
MIYNINPGAFGGELRNGDLVALCNTIAYLRLKNNQLISFHMKPGTVAKTDYVQQFFNYFLETTDFFSKEPGEVDLPWKRVNLWDFRAISGDVVHIKNEEKQEKKIVIVPLFDAPYNVYRNWPPGFLENLIETYTKEEYQEHKKFILAKDEMNIAGWKTCTNLLEGLQHIKTCSIFIGGETGTSMFASVLQPAPPELLYFYSGRGLIHTTPLHIFNGKGKLMSYWQDFEGTNWN